jgi:DNA-binding NarL/FixJ family response regulator
LTIIKDMALEVLPVSIKTNFLVVDDHLMLRRGLVQILAHRPELSFVGEAATGAEALALARSLSPDLVFLDINLPDMNGPEVTRQMLAILPAVKIIIFSCAVERAVVDEALQAGARGYLAKTGGMQELWQALEAVMAGKLFLSPEVSTDILEDYRRSLLEGSGPLKQQLSEREKQLLRMVAEGRRNKEMAGELAITTKSVETYRSRIMKKLGYSSSAELVRYAVREGIAAP